MLENANTFRNMESELDINRRKYYGFLIGLSTTQYSPERVVERTHDYENLGSLATLKPYMVNQRKYAAERRKKSVQQLKSKSRSPPRPKLQIDTGGSAQKIAV